jgi:hypothetical protein
MQAQCRPGQIQCIRLRESYIFYFETKRFFEQLQQTRPSNPELISAVKIKTRYEIKVKNRPRQILLAKQNFSSGTLFKTIGAPVVGRRPAPRE